MASTDRRTDRRRRLEATIGRIFRDLALELSRLADSRDQLASEIEAVFSRYPHAPVLLSVPGIGARTDRS